MRRFGLFTNKRFTAMGILLLLILLVLIPLAPTAIAQEEDDEDSEEEHDYLFDGWMRTVAQVLCITTMVIALLIPISLVVLIIVIRIRINILEKRMLKEFEENRMKPFLPYRGRT